MPDDSASSIASDAAYEPRNLPVPVKPQRESVENWIVRMFRTLFGWKPSSREALEDVLEALPPGESGFSPEESRMLKNILGLRERRVGDVMVPRADIIAVQQDIKLGELMRMFEGAGHSRLVVYNDTLDEPVGMAAIRDVIALLARMQGTRIHLALVVDEYGGSDGLVSIEDIVEQVVGEIGDEHDEDETPQGGRHSDGSFIRTARAHLEDVGAPVGSDFDAGDSAQEVDTLGGYLMTRAGRLPVRGELIPGPGLFEFEVLDADPRRIKRVRITRLKERRDRPREQRRRGEPDAVLADTTPPKLSIDIMPKDGGQTSPPNSQRP